MPQLPRGISQAVRRIQIPIPQGLKPALILLPYGTAEAVPFQGAGSFRGSLRLQRDALGAWIPGHGLLGEHLVRVVFEGLGFGQDR